MFKTNGSEATRAAFHSSDMAIRGPAIQAKGARHVHTLYLNYIFRGIFAASLNLLICCLVFLKIMCDRSQVAL